MGLFDKLFKSKKKDDNYEILTTPEKILASASSPVLPLFNVEEEYGDKVYSFRISEDFTVFDSHCEMDPAYQYYPYTDDKYDEYCDELPVIAIGPNDRIYDACQAVENDEEVTDLEITKLEGNQNFLFKTTFEERGKVIYAYGFAGYTAREYEAFMLTYNPDVKGTALELKLKAALDNVIKTYSERDLDV